MASGARTMMWLTWAMLALLSGGLLKACEQPPQSMISGSVATVKINGQAYKLEIAATDAVRLKGLGQRTSIPEDGGMIFVFPPSQVRVQEFLMRDCPINIDIIYLDGAGRVLSFHEMKAELPRDPAKGEGTIGEIGNAAYEGRLKRYSSRYPATFVIELKEGSIKKLGVKDGDLIELDAPGLKSMAR